MEQLPGADSVFLAMETHDAPAHVGGLTVLDPSDAPDFGFEKLLATVDERIRLEPRFTSRLRELPLGLDRPYLEPDPDFDVRRHVHRIAVPSPGGMRELAELAGVASVSADLDSKSVTVEWGSPATGESISGRLAEINYPPAE